jgi:hypothetical protein
MKNLMRYTSGRVYEAAHGRPCTTEVNVVEISVGPRILPPDPDNIASLIESYPTHQADNAAQGASDL